MAVRSLSEREFSRQVLADPGPVMVAFRAAWCAPSQEMSSLVDDVAARFDGRVKVILVDVDADPMTNKICRQFKVNRLPMMMVFRNGHVADFVGGQVPAETVVDLIKQHVRSVIEVNEFNFEAEVLLSPVPVLVHVTAAWCAASQELVSAVDATADRFGSKARVVRLEYGPENTRVCAQFGFRRVPTLALFNRGEIEDQIFGRMEGGTNAESNIAEMLGRVIL
jgi:thioredoxin 1